MQAEFQITDPEGDTIRVEPIPEREGMPYRVHVSASSGGVYLTAAELRSLADAAEEITGTVRAERFMPTVEDLQESKSEEPDVVRDLSHTLPLIEAAKDLLRRAAPADSGDLVVFLGDN